MLQYMLLLLYISEFCWEALSELCRVLCERRDVSAAFETFHGEAKSIHYRVDVFYSFSFFFFFFHPGLVVLVYVYVCVVVNTRRRRRRVECVDVFFSSPNPTLAKTFFDKVSLVLLLF
jgi:hypothetical protein